MMLNHPAEWWWKTWDDSKPPKSEAVRHLELHKVTQWAAVKWDDTKPPQEVVVRNLEQHESTPISGCDTLGMMQNHPVSGSETPGITQSHSNQRKWKTWDDKNSPSLSDNVIPGALQNYSKEQTKQNKNHTLFDTELPQWMAVEKMWWRRNTPVSSSGHQWQCKTTTVSVLGYLRWQKATPVRGRKTHETTQSHPS